MKKGFTLIELIMVVAIISLLTSIVLSSLTTARQKGNDTARIQVVHEVQSALQLYVTKNGSYPGGDQTTLVNYLVNSSEKYIGSIDPRIVYKGISINNGACTSNCASYHLGIPLIGLDNKALTTDKDIITGNFDGTKDDCTATGPASIPDKCFDITP